MFSSSTTFSMSPFRKIRDFTINKHSLKDPAFDTPLPLDEPAELAQGMKDVEHIRSQYEGLLTNGQMISGAAYDLSRAIHDMASFMLETFTHFLDTETENVFSMLSKVQFEISKLLDLFAAHISQTIITPTEMMMNELQLVQVMKEQYDEKRQAYNQTWREIQKTKMTNGKAQNGNQKSGVAKEDFEDQAHALGFRLQSLKQGHCHSLITQAARYQSAHMHFFSNGLASISALEPIMKQIASENNIDRDLEKVDIVSDGTLDFAEREGFSSVNGGESESFTSSPSAFHMLDESEIILSTVSNSRLVPASSSFYEKDDHVAESTNNKFSMYVLPSPSTAAGRNNFQMKGNEGGLRCDLKQPLISQEPRVNSEIQPSETCLKDEKAFDERSFLLNDAKPGLPDSFQKILRSFSHSGPMTNRYLVNDRHGNVTQKNMASLPSHIDQRENSYKSGPIAVRTAHFATSSAILSPPQVNELHKLPLPPSPRLGTTTRNASCVVKTPQELTSLKSMTTSPLPVPPCLGARSLSIPASTKDLEFHRHSEKEMEKNFPFPSLQSIMLPVVTSKLH